MSAPLQLGTPHHVRLTVTDVERSRAFYTEILGFDIALEGPPADDPGGLMADTLQGGVVLINAGVMIGLRPVRAEHADDRFNPFRVGLDHVSFSVGSRDDLDVAGGSTTSTRWSTAPSGRCRPSGWRSSRHSPPTAWRWN